MCEDIRKPATYCLSWVGLEQLTACTDMKNCSEEPWKSWFWTTPDYKFPADFSIVPNFFVALQNDPSGVIHLAYSTLNGNFGTTTGRDILYSVCEYSKLLLFNSTIEINEIIGIVFATVERVHEFDAYTVHF